MDNGDDKDNYCGDRVMMRRRRKTRTTIGKNEDEDKDDYCCH